MHRRGRREVQEREIILSVYANSETFIRFGFKPRKALVPLCVTLRSALTLHPVPLHPVATLGASSTSGGHIVAIAPRGGHRGLRPGLPFRCARGTSSPMTSSGASSLPFRQAEGLRVRALCLRPPAGTLSLSRRAPCTVIPRMYFPEGSGLKFDFCLEFIS